MSKWIGYAVSVNCGEPLGCYQGTILDADGTTITLTKAFRNGFPYPKSQVTLNAADIKELKIIETRPERPEQTHSTVAVSKSSKKAARSTVCENLQANPSSSGNQSSLGNVGNTGGNKAGNTRNAPAPARSKPIDIQGIRQPKVNTHTGSFGQPRGGGGSGGGVGVMSRRRDEACFGALASPHLQPDFDFEGNLALFDKRALWDQMNSQKPDLVRQAVEGGKFRHDENVLGGPAQAGRCTEVPARWRGPHDYVTDDGLRLPSAARPLRRALWTSADRQGLLHSSCSFLSRAAADVLLRLVGGGRRLEPRNAHQQPVAAVIAAPPARGSPQPAALAALIAARLLHDHSVRVACYMRPSTTALPDEIQREIAALALCGIRVANSLDSLPRPDAILLALHDPLGGEQYDTDEGVEDMGEGCNEAEWAKNMRSAAVVLEPAVGPRAGWGGLTPRASIVAGLPPSLPPSLGRVFLVALGLPPSLFSALDIVYRPPFGANALLPLHQADD